MKKLTARQNEVFNFIRYFINDHGFPPTIREVGDRFKISVKGSYDHIKALEKKGYIKCNLKRSRAIEVIGGKQEKENTKMKTVPILGTVAAGLPLFAEENFDGNVEIPADYTGNGRHFALKVQGDSMKNIGILSGDIAIINHQETADNGEIVVAMVNDAVTLKRIYKEKNRIKLKSENEEYPPIYTQEARVIGKLSCIIRKY
jgi:repressor LexA